MCHSHSVHHPNNGQCIAARLDAHAIALKALIRLVSIKKQNRCVALSRLYPTCFDQKTKLSLVSIKKQNRRAHGRRPLFFIFYLLPCPALPCFEFSFCRQGQEEEVTHGTFFPFAARDRRRKLHPTLPTRFCHRICDKVVQNRQPCNRQTPPMLPLYIRCKSQIWRNQLMDAKF